MMNDLWPHQLSFIERAQQHAGFGVFAGLGTGKSRIALEIAKEREAKRILILAPRAAMPVWPAQISEYADWIWTVPDHDTLIRWMTRTPTIAERLNYIKTAIVRPHNYGTPYAVILNYEASWREPMASWLGSQLWDIIIADEAHKLKAPGGKQSKFASRLAMVSKARLALTGTPLAHSPLDAYALYRFLDKSVFGTSFVAFKAQYALMDPFYPNKFLRLINPQLFKEKFDSISMQVATDDVLTLPEGFHQFREFFLPPDARAVYDSLKDQFCAEYRDHLITPANAGVRLLRLQQVTSGFVTRDREEKPTFLHSGKIELLREIIEELPENEPLVIFCRFTADLEAVQALAAELKLSYSELSGHRNDLADWQRGQSQVLGVQIQAGSVGIDLTRARYAIYYSVGFSLTDYLQSLARIRRPGQTRNCFYIYLVADSTIDNVVYRALRKREDLIKAVLTGMVE
jgi:SNF2 family DNA or RNA helicase